MHQYYSKLLGLKSAVDSGNVDDQADPTDRYKIIMPDALKAFPVSLLISYYKFSGCPLLNNDLHHICFFK